MGRSGYSDECENWDLIRWRGRVKSAIRGKRGQALLRELRDALDAMPEKRLIADEFVRDGEACALGCVALRRGIEDAESIDSTEHEYLAGIFNVAPCLVQEIEFENDENGGPSPEQRWEWMRKWVEKNIREQEAAAT